MSAGGGSDHFSGRRAIDVRADKLSRALAEQMRLYEAAFRRMGKVMAKAQMDVAKAAAPATSRAAHRSGAYGLFQMLPAGRDSGVVQRRRGWISPALPPPPHLTIDIPPGETLPAKMERWRRTYAIHDFSVDWGAETVEIPIAGTHRVACKPGRLSGTIFIVFADGERLTFPAPQQSLGVELDIDEVERIIAAYCGIGVKTPPALKVQADVFLGWRHWSVYADGGLGGQFVHSPDWRDQHWATARCTQGHTTVPYPGCHCGFNAYFAPRRSAALVRSSPFRDPHSTVLGVMLGRGVTEVHMDGFRSREARPLVLVLSPGPEALLRRVRHRTGVPVMAFEDAKAFALEHGSLVPDEAMPDGFDAARVALGHDPRDPAHWVIPH